MTFVLLSRIVAASGAALGGTVGARARHSRRQTLLRTTSSSLPFIMCGLPSMMISNIRSSRLSTAGCSSPPEVGPKWCQCEVRTCRCPTTLPRRPLLFEPAPFEVPLPAPPRPEELGLEGLLRDVPTAGRFRTLRPSNLAQGSVKNRGKTKQKQDAVLDPDHSVDDTEGG